MLCISSVVSFRFGMNRLKHFGLTVGNNLESTHMTDDDISYAKRNYSILSHLCKFNNTQMSSIKVCIHTIAKNENRYLPEWLEHHRKIGVDHFFIYDNNTKDGEVIDDSADDITVVKTWRDVCFGGIEHIIMQDFYYSDYTKEYDWVAFIDVDEFIMCDDIKACLDDVVDENIGSIVLPPVNYGCAGEIHYRDEPVMKRFKYANAKRVQWAKCIVRTKGLININSPYIQHWLSLVDKKICLIDGTEVPKTLTNVKDAPIDKIHIDHYFIKSIEEFIQRKLNVPYTLNKTTVKINIDTIVDWIKEYDEDVLELPEVKELIEEARKKSSETKSESKSKSSTSSAPSHPSHFPQRVRWGNYGGFYASYYRQMYGKPLWGKK